MKIILLNGPPRSGKDECAKILLHNRPCVLERFSSPLKQAISGLLDRPTWELEETKDEKLYFGNKFSYRDLQIWLSEICIKPMFGQRVFGHLLGQRLVEAGLSKVNYVVVADSGFEDELFGLEDMGNWDIKIIRIRRPGRDYMGDSRAYLKNPDYKIYNNGTLEDLEEQLMFVIKDIEK